MRAPFLTMKDVLLDLSKKCVLAEYYLPVLFVFRISKGGLYEQEI